MRSVVARSAGCVSARDRPQGRLGVGAASSASYPPADRGLVALQRAIGNRAVGRLLCRTADDPWDTTPAERTAERLSRQRETTTRLLAQQIVDADAQGWRSMSVTIEYNGRELSFDFEKHDRVGSAAASAAHVTFDDARSSVDHQVEMLVMGGPGSVAVEYGRDRNGPMQLVRWKRTDAPKGHPTSAGRNPASTLGECNESDTDYGECLNRERVAAYRAAIQAAGELADAYYNPFSGGGVGLPEIPITSLWGVLKGTYKNARIVRDLKNVARFSAAERRALLDKLLVAEVNGLTLLANDVKGRGAMSGHTVEIATAVTKRGETVYVAGLNSAGKWTSAQLDRLNDLGIRIAPQRKQLFSGMKGQPHAEENIAAYLTRKGWKGTRWSRAVVGDPTRKGVASFVCQNCQNMIRLVGGRIEPGLGGF